MKIKKIIALGALMSILSSYAGVINYSYATDIEVNVAEEQTEINDIKQENELFLDAAENGVVENIQEEIATPEEEKIEEGKQASRKNIVKEESTNFAADSKFDIWLAVIERSTIEYTGERFDLDQYGFWFKDKNKNYYNLEEGKDYKRSYSTTDWVSVGKIVITFTGIGDYKGWSYEQSFFITPRAIENVRIADYTENTISIKWDKYQYDCDKIMISVFCRSDGSYLGDYELDKDATEYTLEGLKPGFNYCIDVNAVKNSAYGRYELEGTTIPTNFAKNISVKKNGETSIISWKKIENSGYEVYVKNITDSDFELLGDTLDNSLNVDSAKLKDGYQLKIKTYIYNYEKTEKIYSKEEAIYYPGIIPENITGDKISQELDGIKLTWNKMEEINGYKIYRATAKEGEYKLITTIDDLSISEYKDTSAVTGKKYYYKILAYNSLSGSEYESIGSNILEKMLVKGNTSLSVRSYGTSAKLTWNKVEKATGYKIYRATSKNGTYTKIKTISKNTTLTYTDKNKNGKAYFYKTRAYYTANGTTYHSNYSAINEKTPYAKAEATVSYSTSKYVLVKWKKISGVKGYNIYRATSKNGTYKKIKTIKSGKTISYKDKNLDLGQGYYYKVRGYNGSKFGQYSAAKVVGTGTINQQINKNYKLKKVDLGLDEVNKSLDYLIEKAYEQAKSKENNPCSSNYQKIKAIYRYVETNLKHADGYNCWHFSGTLCAALNRIGINAYCVGGQTKSTSGSMTAHTWVQLNVNGVKYMLDPSIDRHIADQLKKKVRYDRFLVKFSAVKKSYKDYGKEENPSYIVDFRNKTYIWYYFTQRP